MTTSTPPHPVYLLLPEPVAGVVDADVDSGKDASSLSRGHTVVAVYSHKGLVLAAQDSFFERSETKPNTWFSSYSAVVYACQRWNQKLMIISIASVVGFGSVSANRNNSSDEMLLLGHSKQTFSGWH